MQVSLKTMVEQVTDPDNPELDEPEGSDEVVTHLHSLCPFWDYTDAGKALPVCEQWKEEDIIRST
jgi:hypothetical protein